MPAGYILVDNSLGLNGLVEAVEVEVAPQISTKITSAIKTVVKEIISDQAVESVELTINTAEVEKLEQLVKTAEKGAIGMTFGVANAVLGTITLKDGKKQSVVLTSEVLSAMNPKVDIQNISTTMLASPVEQAIAITGNVEAIVKEVTPILEADQEQNKAFCIVIGKIGTSMIL